MNLIIWLGDYRTVYLFQVHLYERLRTLTSKMKRSQNETLATELRPKSMRCEFIRRSSSGIYKSLPETVQTLFDSQIASLTGSNSSKWLSTLSSSTESLL